MSASVADWRLQIPQLKLEGNNITSRNISAMPARQAPPMLPTNPISAITAEAMASMAAMLGSAKAHKPGQDGAAEQ